MKKLILTALTCAVIAGPALAATTYTVDTMRYHNGGAYVAHFNVRYNLDNGKNCAVYIDNQSKTEAGDPNVTVDLLSRMFKIHDGPSDCLVNGRIPDGTRVWGKVSIALGEEKSCKEDKSKLVVGSNGKTVEYETKGTTTEGNSCKQLKP